MNIMDVAIPYAEEVGITHHEAVERLEEMREFFADNPVLWNWFKTSVDHKLEGATNAAVMTGTGEAS